MIPYSTYVVHNATNNDVYLKISYCNFASILTEKYEQYDMNKDIKTS